MSAPRQHATPGETARAPCVASLGAAMEQRPLPGNGE